MSFHAGLDVYRSHRASLVFHNLGIEVWVVWFRVLICIMIGQWSLLWGEFRTDQLILVDSLGEQIDRSMDDSCGPWIRVGSPLFRRMRLLLFMKFSIILPLWSVLVW